ncbi:outer membrane protein [Spirochaetia bacterium]|nr:outer membrane protein [Spirochaetia bacterium]
MRMKSFIRKKAVFFAFFLISGLGMALHAQQLTRIAVVDMPRVYTAFFPDSRAARQFDEESAKVQTDVDKMMAEIQRLKNRHLDALAKGEQSQATRLENEIYKKSEELKYYFEVKTAELEDKKNKLLTSDSFLNQVYDEIKRLAESEGYTMVLNLKETKGILWYSPSVDITEKLIQNHSSRADR